MSVALRAAPLVLVAAVVQVTTISGTRLLGAEPDLLLVTIVCLALVSGSIPGAVAGFAGGLLVDVMTLGTLGTSSILLTLAGYWAGRYGETTGRGRPYAPSLAAFLLGQPVSARDALITALPSALLAAVLALGVIRICRAVLAEPPGFERSRQVELV